MPSWTLNKQKRSIFSGIYNFLFGNEDEVIDQIQSDFSRLQNNFKQIVSDEHRSFKEIIGDNHRLGESLNSLKLQEIADRYEAMNSQMEINLLHKLQLVTKKVETICNTIEDTASLITEMLLMQRAGSSNMCLSNHILRGCINPLQSRIILREPKYLDLKLKSMKLLRRKYISCEVTNDPTQAYIFPKYFL